MLHKLLNSVVRTLSEIRNPASARIPVSYLRACTIKTINALLIITLGILRSILYDVLLFCVAWRTP